MLRDRDRAAFEILADTPVTFGYSDAAAELRANRPMIGVDPCGQIREIRFTNRSRLPLRESTGVPRDDGLVGRRITARRIAK